MTMQTATPAAPIDAAFLAEIESYLAPYGLKVTKARAMRGTSTEPKPLTATAVRKMRREHPNDHTEHVDGCPLCAFRADASDHAGHSVQVDTCRFCTYEQVVARSPFPSTLRRLPEQARYNRAYRAWQHARRRYGAGTVRTDYRGQRPEIIGHPRVAHLQALLDRLSNPRLAA